MGQRVLILGGDGYLGWPTAMHLSARGHKVLAVDNYSRRQMARDRDIESLVPNPNLHMRTRLWQQASGHDVQFKIGDLRDWEFVKEIFSEFKPTAVVHYAEQPSAPYSMLGRKEAHFTLTNNLEVTLNAIYGIKEFCPDAHLIKLGTMGEYGTPNIDIEEGWIEIEHKKRKDKFLFPRQAGSLYHTTKVMDTDLLWFYVRTWGLRVTDLMQGPVYGIHTDESAQNPTLATNFHYDDIFGTVLNRFIAQAVVGCPLTVYGKGGQKRGFLNIKDTMNCIELALNNPAGVKELRILNQFTEIFSVMELAEKVHDVGQKLKLKVKIEPIKNPRLEAEEHYYNAKNSGLLELGLQPHLLTEDVLVEIFEAILPYGEKINKDRLYPSVTWK